MSESPEQRDPDLDQDRSAIRSLSNGLNQRLVKSWRTSMSVRCHNNTEIFIYLDPHRGVFYARIPETDDGALYAAETARALMNRMQEVMKDLLEEERRKALDLRGWERCIRIVYTGGDVYGPTLVDGHPERRWGGRYRFAWSAPVDVAMVPSVGPFSFVRFERSLRPDNRTWDEREWLEDFEYRYALWEKSDPKTGGSRMTQEEHRNARPFREHSTHLVREGDLHVDRRENKIVRVLPWSKITWKRLHDFSSRFTELDAALTAFLSEAEAERFLMMLDEQRPRLLSDSGR